MEALGRVVRRADIAHDWEYAPGQVVSRVGSNLGRSYCLPSLRTRQIFSIGQ